ncbi:MAG: hypothetical protein AB7R69_02520 [Candidatus Babeliales bacterium]
MKKYTVLLIISLGIHSLVAAPMQDIPKEWENYHNRRWPQFLVDFYDKMRETLHDIGMEISHVPEKLYSLIAHHPHYNDQAAVRYTECDDICQDEKKFIENRMLVIKKSLEQYLEKPLEDGKVPRIACIFSGGGFRAMLTTLGFLHGAKQIGLLDCSLYCVGLSGSSWALAPWIASRKSLKEYIFELQHKLYDGIDHINDPYELSELFQIIITKLIARQFVSTMDIYGGVIANTILKQFVKNPMLIRLTDSHAHIKDGSFPMPLYTAIQSYQNPYEWMEFSPFEVGSSFLKSYIPTWAYGRKFRDGVSIDKAPEQTLGYFMGVFGSAFEVSLKDVVSLSANNLSYLGHQLPDFLAKAFKKALDLIVSSFLGDIRLFPSMLLNFTHNMANSPIKEDITISLVDAGLDFNLPFPPVLRAARAVDIIIVYDASANIQGAPELLKARDYALKKGLKFPPINLEIIDKQFVSVLEDPEDPEVPVIIYFPRIKNNCYSPHFDPDFCIAYDYCNTFNFNYSAEEAKLLTGFAEFTIKENVDVVAHAINRVLERKYGYEKPISVTPLVDAVDIVGITA